MIGRNHLIIKITPKNVRAYNYTHVVLYNICCANASRLMLNKLIGIDNTRSTAKIITLTNGST